MRKRLLTFMLALALCFGLAAPAFAAEAATPGNVAIGTAAPAASAFIDVPPGTYYAKAVDWAVAQGIVNGMTATTFGPDTPCTTAHILAFLWRSAGRPGGSTGMSWADELVAVTNWARGKGIDVPADLNTVCTRASSVTYMWKAAGSPEPRTSPSFTDVSAYAYCAKPVAWAVENGITEGTGNGAFSPDLGCNRGQIVTLLYREKVEQLHVYSTSPGISLAMNECNYLRVRESGTSYDFSSANLSVQTIWNDAHGKDRTVTWSVSDPDVLELTMMKWGGDDLWPIFTGKKAGQRQGHLPRGGRGRPRGGSLLLRHGFGPQ